MARDGRGLPGRRSARTGLRRPAGRPADQPRGLLGACRRSSATTSTRWSCSPPLELHGLVDANEDYWEHGAGADPPATDVRLRQPRHLRLGSARRLGLQRRPSADAGRRGAARRPARCQTGHDNDLAAHSVLAPFGIDATQVGAAAGTVRTAASARWSWRSGRTTRCARWSTRTRRWSRHRLRHAGRKGRLHRLAAHPLRPRVRPPRRRRPLHRRPPRAVGDGAARDRGADRERREPRRSRPQVARRLALFPVLHGPVDRRGRLPPRQAPPPHPPAGPRDRLGDRPVQRDDRRCRAPGAVGGAPLVPARPLRGARRPRAAPLHRRRRGGPPQRLASRTSSRAASPVSTPGSSARTGRAACRVGCSASTGCTRRSAATPC